MDAAGFGVEQKGIFPYLFVNDSNTSLEYVGKTPAFKYFEGIDINEYRLYSKEFSNNWNLRQETIKYCIQDCIVLYQILSKFSNEVTSTLNVSLKHTPTTSSLAIKSFLTNYFSPNHKLPIITPQGWETYNFIKQSYTGGHVDVYRAHGFDLYYYDVDSLYPGSMLSLMPVGNPIYFEGDINSIHAIKDFVFEPNSKDPLKRPYGFFEVEVTAPYNLEYPILQTRVQTDDGYRTMTPLGKWTGVYSSEEIYNAMDNFGYKFKILRGYLFHREYVFNDFVDHFYNMKCNTPSLKSNPRYFIAKLLLNSLNGSRLQIGNYRYLIRISII